jgi:zinc transporter ZupT
MLTVFGSVAVAIMLLAYWLERRSKWMVLLFAAGSALTSVYSGLAAVYPITVIEALWAAVALQRFAHRLQQERRPAPQAPG